MSGTSNLEPDPPDRYVVVGNPVAHSLSPEIHARFARQTGERIEYGRLLAPPDGFSACVTAFISSGGRGLNVTVPFKEEAAGWVDQLTAGAAQAQAVNTIVVAADGSTTGHNTDGPGLIVDLERLAPQIHGARVLLLGAGGAARGVALPLLAGGAGVPAPAAELVIANRSVGKAQAIAAELSAAGYRAVSGVGLNELSGNFELVINATSTGLSGGIPALDPGPLRGAFCYDLFYGGVTPFCRWALEHGAGAAYDGLGMLVEQAALAFELWRGVRPETGPVLAALREAG